MKTHKDSLTLFQTMAEQEEREIKSLHEKVVALEAGIKTFKMARSVLTRKLRVITKKHLQTKNRFAYEVLRLKKPAGV